MGKDQSEYKNMTYEGYGPHGIAVFVDTLTDNPTRTVADVRSVFNKFSGTLGTMGSLAYLFDHKCVFTFKKPATVDMDELILDLIDFGVEEDYDMDEEEGTITITAIRRATVPSRSIWKSRASRMSAVNSLISRTI